ncbi:hypothetical protein WJX81_007522 [Elliptochloris bilobata]|uniref:Amidase domain-containing protein n=1 Tax=Elliptochloris bilobata TaxID=381761 RepID=A0AAW1QY66_9CHLO
MFYVMATRPTEHSKRCPAMAPPDNRNGAFLPEDIVIEGAASGPLKGLTFAAKDLYDIKGYVTGFGNPEWAATHAPAAATAPAVQALLDAGARLVGKVHMDELAYSLGGENARYGTPVNPACPDRVPGGSSSGSAVAVADGSCDIALGSDTGGSVRVPASYCGILGLRPTHGRVPMEGTCALAPSFDTGGFFAKDMSVLQKAADVLLEPATRRPTSFKRLLVATDAFAIADAHVKDALFKALQAAEPALKEEIGGLVETEMGDAKTGTLEAWADQNCVSENCESWGVLGGWIEEHKPAFGPGIVERFLWSKDVTPDKVEAAAAARVAITERLEGLLGDDGAILLPSTPTTAPRLRMSLAEIDPLWQRIICLVAPAAEAGLPQVSLPIVQVDGCPQGLGIIGPRGRDEDLLRLSAHIMELLKRPQASKAEV